VGDRVEWTSLKDGDLGRGHGIFRRLSPGGPLIIERYTGVCGGTADDLRVIEVTKAVADAPPDMRITVPTSAQAIVSTDGSGAGRQAVAGFGLDEEDNAPATIE
jgi:hypothetical protein